MIMKKESSVSLKDFISQHRETLIVIAGLAVLWFVFYGKLLAGQCFLWEDFREQAFPNFVFAVKSLKQGAFPFWTPYEFSGMPFFSDPQTTLFYPPHWVLLLMGVAFGPSSLLLTWYLLLHILVLGIGVYLLGKEFGFTRTTAFFCAVSGMFTGYISLHVIHTIFIYVIAWFPFAFWAFSRSLRMGDVRFVAIGALFYGVSTLGGYPQYSLHMFYLFGLYAVVDAISKWKENRKAAVGALVFFFVFSGLGLTLAVVSYFPALKHMALSVRETMTFEESAGGSLPLSRFLSFIIPGFFGYVSGDGAGSPYWGFPGQTFYFWETNAFVGVTTVLLALIGIVRVRARKEVVFFCIVGVVSFLLALGDNTPLYEIAFRLVPGFGTFRIPGRFTLWLSVSLILLAGFGLDLLLRESSEESAKKKGYIAASVVGGAIAIGLLVFLAGAFDVSSRYLSNQQVREHARNAAGMALLFGVLAFGLISLAKLQKFRKYVALGLSVVVFIELFAFGAKFGCSSVNPESYYKRYTLQTLVRELESEDFRVQSRLYQGPNKGEMLFPRNLGNVLEYPLTEGYNQLMLKRYSKFIFEVDEEVTQKLLGVRYKKLAGQHQMARLQHAPWNYLSTSLHVVDDEDGLVQFMNSDEFIPGETVVSLTSPGLDIDSACDPMGEIQVVSKGLSGTVLKVSTSCSAILARRDVYYPEWKATLDGKPADIFPVNLLFQGITVPKGTHTVEISYRSTRLLAGAAVSTGSLVLCILLIVGSSLGVFRLNQAWLGFSGKEVQ